MGAGVPQNLLRWNGKTSHMGLPYINVKAVAQLVSKTRLRRLSLMMRQLAGATAAGLGNLRVGYVILVC
jgi:hypothetical protein